MNKKYLLIGMGVLLAAGIVWLGRTVYRARNNIVTLSVYNAPLADVIRQLERQTRETILAGKGLDVKVTLDVKNLPLDEVLDRLGQQIGANWSQWHAVYGSERALSKLEAALRDRTDLGQAGWTNLASPHFPAGGNERVVIGRPDGKITEDIVANGNGGVVVTRSKPMIVRLNGSDAEGGNAEAAVREQLKAAGADDSVVAQVGGALREATMDVDVQAPGPGSHRVVKADGPRPMVRMITRTSDGRGGITEEIWSPENLVLEDRLSPKLGDTVIETPSAAAAKKVAEKVKAAWTTLYVLRKSPGGFPFGGAMVRKIHAGGAGGTNGVHGEAPSLPDLEAVVRRAEAENFTRLTPEQRVQRAREKQAAKPNP